MKKRALAILLIVCLSLTLLSTAALAAEPVNYVALGDSIAAGFALEGYTGVGSTPATGYVALVKAGLGADTKLTDLSVSGQNTTQLLALLETEAYAKAVAEADVITVSIGSNDLLIPSLALIAQFLGIDTGDPDKAEAQYAAALGTDAMEMAKKIAEICAYLSTEEVQTALSAGIAGFKTNWDALVAKLTALNPDAVIVATNYYNPYKTIEYPAMNINFGSLAQAFLDDMNAYVTASPLNGTAYALVDVVNIEPNVKIDMADVAASRLDPHPSAAGHAAIAQSILAALAKIDMPFEDVAKDAAYYEAVHTVYHAGLMNGTGAATFEPAAALDRSMTVTVLYRVAGQPETEFKPVFTDVADGQWYSKAVVWANALGIIEGVGENVFDVEGALTFEQLAAIVCRFSGKMGVDTTVTLDETAVAALTATVSDDWAKAPVAWMFQSGLWSAEMAEGFVATANVSRAEVAVLMAGLYATMAAAPAAPVAPAA